MRLGYFGVGLHDQMEVPEADKLLEIVGQIEGRPAKILLDTGCSTYVLSSSFAKRNGIPGIPMRPRPVDLAVSSARAQLTHKTAPLELRIGKTVITKSLYLLPVPQFDAIVGMPFFKQNEIDLAGLDSKGIWNGTSRRTATRNASHASSGPPDSTETGYAATIQRHFSIISARTTRIKAATRPVAKGWKDQTIDKPVRCTSPICQE